jgi:type III pantothenate kinase
MPQFPLVALDIGNARIKVGLFRSTSGRGLPEPELSLHLPGRESQWQELHELFRDEAALSWWVGSVNRPATTQFADWLRTQRPSDRVILLSADDLPLAVELPRADMVGIDRLINAVAANRLREADRPAIVVDVGTAITVDLVSAVGAFQGGSILPGIGMSARALHEFTDLLPLLPIEELATAPSALGTSTETAMRSGLFWGAVGAIRQLIDRLDPGGQGQVFLTGGAGTSVAELLGRETLCMPHLTLAGIAVTAAAGDGAAGDDMA